MARQSQLLSISITPLLTKSFFFMFDPHRTRRNDRRYYTKKGQILQARNISVPFTIDRSKVDAYKEYIIQNNLISSPSLPPPVIPTIDSVQFSDDSNIYPISAFNLSTRNVTIGGKSQTIILSTFANNSTFWRVDLLYLPSESDTYPIPPGCRYLSFTGSGTLDDSFALFSNGEKLLTIAQHLPSLISAWIQTSFISKSLINISDMPA